MSSIMSVNPGVYFAFVQGEGVIMDLVEDRYYGLGAQSAAMWRALTGESLVECDADGVGLSSGEAGAPCSAMIEKQAKVWEEAKLVRWRSDGRAGERAEVPRLKPVGLPATIGLDEIEVGAGVPSPRALSRLTYGFWWSRRALKRHGLSWTVSRVQQIPVAPVIEQGALENDLKRMVRLYYSVRRLMSQGRDDCLPRSLALATALRCVGVEVDICFGVRKFPFLAHAWLEAGGRVINERPRAIQKYTLLARF
jgi:hypothetical protein